MSKLAFLPPLCFLFIGGLNTRIPFQILRYTPDGWLYQLLYRFIVALKHKYQGRKAVSSIQDRTKAIMRMAWYNFEFLSLLSG